MLTVEGAFDWGATFGFGVSQSRPFLDSHRLARVTAIAKDLFGDSVVVAAEPLQADMEGLGPVNDVTVAPGGVRQSYGFGLRVGCLKDSPFLERARSNAADFWRVNEAALRVEFGSADYERVLGMIETVQVPHALIVAFELGVGFLRIHVELPAEPLPGAVVRGLFKAFENAGYGEMDMTGVKCNAVLAGWRRAVTAEFQTGAAPIVTVTQRPVDPAFVEFAGFQGIVFCDSLAAFEGDPEELFRSSDNRHDFVWGVLKVRATWLIVRVVGVPGFEVSGKFNARSFTGGGCSLSSIVSLFQY
jgi:hypothetical protein